MMPQDFLFLNESIFQSSERTAFQKLKVFVYSSLWRATLSLTYTWAKYKRFVFGTKSECFEHSCSCNSHIFHIYYYYGYFCMQYFSSYSNSWGLSKYAIYFHIVPKQLHIQNSTNTQYIIAKCFTKTDPTVQKSLLGHVAFLIMICHWFQRRQYIFRLAYRECIMYMMPQCHVPQRIFDFRAHLLS